jgi:hypothetical protein
MTVEQLAQPETPAGFVEEDWTVGDEPGVKLTAEDGGYAIAQILDDGFTVTWTTPDSAEDAVLKCAGGSMDRQDMEATIRFGSNRAFVAGEDILPFLREHQLVISLT